MSLPERIAAAEEAYRLATHDTGRLRAMRRLTYRCADPDERCTLLDVIDTGTVELGVILHTKRYKYSDAQNLARTNASGRESNTYDGRNHHREHYFFLEESALNYPDDVPLQSLSLQCDHVLAYLLTAAEFRDDLASDTQEVRIRGDLTRYGV